MPAERLYNLCNSTTAGTFCLGKWIVAQCKHCPVVGTSNSSHSWGGLTRVGIAAGTPWAVLTVPLFVSPCTFRIRDSHRSFRASIAWLCESSSHRSSGHPQRKRGFFILSYVSLPNPQGCVSCCLGPSPLIIRISVARVSSYFRVCSFASVL